MSGINSDELIKSICKLCGVTRKEENEGNRVLTKNELLLVQSTIIKLQQDNKELRANQVEVERIVESTINRVLKKGAE